MKKIIFKDEDGSEMEAHLNDNGNFIICIDAGNKDQDFNVYVFEDTIEVQIFIDHLQEMISDHE